MRLILLLFFTIVIAVGIAYFIILRKRQLAKARKKIEELRLQQDTAEIIRQYRQEQVEQSWEEFDRKQWEIRFKDGVE